MDRAFRGVWIDKAIWLHKDLTWMEKLMVTEILSLDNDKGCYASNAYFAEFFSLSNQRVSQIIKALKEKGILSTEYVREGKEIKSRVLRIIDTGIKNIRKGIKNTIGGYQENAKGINTRISNTDNNTDVLDIDLGIDHEKAQPRNGFKKPTLDELTAYLKEKNITKFTAEEFLDHYESNGWMVGKVHMKNWKASIGTWTRNTINNKETWQDREQKQRDETLKRIFQNG